MIRTTVFRMLGFLAGGAVLASAGLAAGMALAPARQAAAVVEPLSTVPPLNRADLPPATAIPASPSPSPTYTVPMTPSALWTQQPNTWPGGTGGWMEGTGGGNWDDGGMRGGMMNGDWRMGGNMGDEGDRYTPRTLPRSARGITTLGAATQAVRAYFAAYNNPDLSVGEVVQFGREFYARVREQNTGRYAFAVLIDPSSGQVWPEPGPNMSWNSRFGQGANTEMTITPGQARFFAQASLDASVPAATAGDPLAFYGFYTFEVWQGNQMIGMVSVNGVTGEVWYHNQYGPYIDRLILKPQGRR